MQWARGPGGKRVLQCEVYLSDGSRLSRSLKTTDTEVEGPRRMRSSALWVGEENRILFYDTGGVRFHETQMSEAPDPLKLAG